MNVSGVHTHSLSCVFFQLQNSAGPPVANQMHKQAAAFRLSGDMAFLYRCNFYGHQDTLYDHSGRHYYFRCFIEGSEDFVFGVGRSLFEVSLFPYPGPNYLVLIFCNSVPGRSIGMQFRVGPHLVLKKQSSSDYGRKVGLQ